MPCNDWQLPGVMHLMLDKPKSFIHMFFFSRPVRLSRVDELEDELDKPTCIRFNVHTFCAVQVHVATSR